MTQSQTLPAQPALGGRKALIGALILGAVAAGLIVAFLASQGNEGTTVAPVSAPVTIVTAKDNIEAGTVITAEMVEEREIPRDLLVAGAFTELKLVEGQTARYPIARGEQVSPARLVEGNATVKSLSFQIPQGLRGFAIPMDNKSGPTALIAPGDFVDVIVSAELVRLNSIGSVTQTLSNDDEPQAAVTLIQNVQVLSVDRKYADNGVVYDQSTRGAPPEDGDDLGFVTLAVSPEQAQLLWLATQQGKVTLTLRAFGDNTVTPLAPIAEPIRIN